MRNVFEFVNVKVTLNNRVLFPDISFTIREGDCLMLRGKNGSGKSLLLELMFSGYTNELRRRYGGLKVEGHIFDSNGNDLLDPHTERTISYVTQNEDFHSNATFLSEAITASRGVGMELDEAWFDELLSLFGIADKKKQKIHRNVSCGEGKIIHLITRILKLKATNILLLDEPLNHLSFQNSKVFNDVLNKLKKENPKLTVVMISHCRAVNFIDQAIQYNYETQQMERIPYLAYNCFDAE